MFSTPSTHTSITSRPALTTLQQVDLAAFDPEVGDQPIILAPEPTGGRFKKLVSRLVGSLSTKDGGGGATAVAFVGGGLHPTVRASASTRVRGSGGGAPGPVNGGLNVDYEVRVCAGGLPAI